MDEITKGISFMAEFIILTLDDKPEDNFRKVAEKGIRTFVVEKANKSIGLHSTILDLQGQSLDNAIMKGVAPITSDVSYIRILNTRDILSSVNHVVVFTILVVVRQDKIRSIAKHSNIKGTWVWLDIAREDESLKIESAKLVNNLYNPTIVMERLYGDEMDYILKAVEQIRMEVLFTDILFSFMNETFTMKEFEEAYNALNGKEVTNMKKKWANKFLDTGEMSEGLAHRPAKLYRFKGSN